MKNNNFYKPQDNMYHRMFTSDPTGSLDDCLPKLFKFKNFINNIQVSGMAFRGNDRFPIKNHKIYKHFFVNNVNILPGDLRRLPDDCFSYSYINIKGDLL